jgi:hypothetical protein
MEKQRYYRVGTVNFYWLYEREDQVSRGYSPLTRARALKKAREAAAVSDLPIELRQRERMNDYVGPPIWGNDQLLGEVALSESRGRLSALAS